MKYLKKFNEDYVNMYEDDPNSPEIMDNLRDIVIELEDEGLEVDLHFNGDMKDYYPYIDCRIIFMRGDVENWKIITPNILDTIDRIFDYMSQNEYYMDGKIRFTTDSMTEINITIDKLKNTEFYNKHDCREIEFGFTKKRLKT